MSPRHFEFQVFLEVPEQLRCVCVLTHSGQRARWNDIPKQEEGFNHGTTLLRVGCLPVNAGWLVDRMRNRLWIDAFRYLTVLDLPR